MTIFVTVAKALIDKVLQNSSEDSIAKDKGFSGFFRNTELSTKQREFTRNLQKSIENFQDQDSDKDKTSLTKLKKLINDTDNKVETQRKTQKLDRGVLNQTLTDINSNLERFYNTLLQHVPILIDMKDDDQQAFHIFCRHAATYLGENIICPKKNGLLMHTVERFSGTASVSIRSNKESSLMTQLNACHKKLRALNTESDDYNVLCNDFIIDAIKKVKAENATICQDSNPITTLPLQVTFLTKVELKQSVTKPTRGRLEIAMNNALTEIDQLINQKTDMPQHQ